MPTLHSPEMATTRSVQVKSEQSPGKLKIRIFKNEYLLDNIIDKDFQAMLFPLTIVPGLFLMSQYRIINNLITPENNVLYCIKSCVGCIILVLCHFLRFKYYSGLLGGFDCDVVFLFIYFDLTFFSATSIIIYIVNYNQRFNVVEIIVNLQHALNYIKIDKLDFLAKQRKRNWLGFIMVFSVYLFHSALACTQFGVLEWLENFILILPLLICDIQVAIVSSVIEIIKNELIEWTKVMEEYKKTIRNEEVINVVSESDMYHAYVCLVKAFRLCSKVSTFSFSYFIMQTFSHILIALEIAIELRRSVPEEFLFHTTVMNAIYCIWNMKNIILIVVLSNASESFYRSVKMAESIVSQIMGNGQTKGEGMRATCKNVLRLNRTALRKLSAFGVFDLDAAFPLRLLGGLVAYTVVILQFAFL